MHLPELQLSGMTPEDFGKWVLQGGGLLALGMKLGDWLSKRAVERHAERRASSEELVEQLKAELARERRECDDEQRAAATRYTEMRIRCENAEREKAIMEGIMWRGGWSQDASGRWTRNGEGGPQG